MSQSQTVFTYENTSVIMEVNPLMERDFDESQAVKSAYDSNGTCYAYDGSAPVFRTETLTFPAISGSNLQSLLLFIETVICGSYRLFTWLDGATMRTARYKNISWQQVSNVYYEVNLTLEVVL